MAAAAALTHPLPSKYSALHVWTHPSIWTKPRSFAAHLVPPSNTTTGMTRVVRVALMPPATTLNSKLVILAQSAAQTAITTELSKYALAVTLATLSLTQPSSNAGRNAHSLIPTTGMLRIAECALQTITTMSLLAYASNAPQDA